MSKLGEIQSANVWRRNCGGITEVFWCYSRIAESS